MSISVSQVKIYYERSAPRPMESFSAESFEVLEGFIQVRTKAGYVLIPRNGNIRKIELDR